MRNVFDQYTQPENRLTHALMCTLDADRSLLKPFLRWLGINRIPRGTLNISEQQVPGMIGKNRGLDPGDEERDGLPDGCFWQEDEETAWTVMIESKVQSRISTDQCRRHLDTAKRAGFETRFLVVLAVDTPSSDDGLPASVASREWRHVYSWFRERSPESEWALRLTEYMEIFEARMLAEDYSIRGTITMFDGIHFSKDNPYNYPEAQRLLRLLGDELQSRESLHEIGVDPVGNRRAAITGHEATAVWDFLPLTVSRGAGNFTDFPHFTMSLRETESSVAITIPNAVKFSFRKRLRAIGLEGFLELLIGIEEGSRVITSRVGGSHINAYALQRHYRSQRSQGMQDAKLNANLLTIVPGKRPSAKYQPQWIEAIYRVLVEKKSNVQFGVSVVFPHGCPEINSPAAIDLFEQSLIAIAPLADFVVAEQREAATLEPETDL